MKLIYCPDCGDMFLIHGIWEDSRMKKYFSNIEDEDEINYRYFCACNNVFAAYVTAEDILYYGEDAVLISLDNKKFERDIINIPLDGKGREISGCYIIPYYCGSTIRVDGIDDVYKYFKNKHLLAALPYLRDKKIERIRIKNPFLKLIYNVFKKWIFISVDDD